MGEHHVADLRGSQFQGSLYFGESHLRRGEYLKAARAFRRAWELADGRDEEELARGLLHLAAAGHKGQAGDERGRSRQLDHARRRLAGFPPVTRRLDLRELTAIVEEHRT